MRAYSIIATGCIAALFLAGCGNPANGAGDDAAVAERTVESTEATRPAEGSTAGATAMNTPQKDSAAKSDAPDQNREVAIKELTGDWKVERLWVDTSGVTAYALDDPSAVGSVMTVTPDQIRWSHAASDTFPSTDICGGPTPIIIRDANAAKATGAPFAAAITHFAIPRNELGPIHEMACAESGNWGPEAAGGSNFYLTSGGRMVMSTYDGAILLLKRQ